GAAAIVQPTLQVGSSSAGYRRLDCDQSTVTMQCVPPGTTTGRFQGGAGLVSTAHPCTPTLGHALVDWLPAMNGGAMRSRGAPWPSRNSTVFATSRTP